MTERRLSQRIQVAVCETGHIVDTIGEPYDIYEIRCPRGHWANEAANYCGTCGAKMKRETSDQS